MNSLRNGIHYIASPQERWAKNGYEGNESGIYCGTFNVPPEIATGDRFAVTCPMCLFYMKTKAQLQLSMEQDKLLEVAKEVAYKKLDGEN